MKTLFSAIAISVSLVCMGTPMPSQSASIIANGADNDGFINQIGSSDAIASITQNGNFNRTGSAGTNSGSFTLPGIQQVISPLSKAVVAQNGDKNSALIAQTYTTGSAVAVTQTAATGATEGNVANVYQATNFAPYFDTVVVNQSGAFAIGNFVNIEQIGFGGGHFVEVNQAGDSLRAEILQQEGVAKSLTVNQSGIDQYASVKQTGNNEGKVHGLIGQSGQANDVFLVQKNVAFSSADIYQVGSGAKKNVMQVTQGDGLRDVSNDVVIARQNGAGNRGTIVQNGCWNFAELDQTGNGNTGTITQINTGVSLAAQNNGWIAQVGNFYTAAITQNGSGNRSGIFQR